ncbi:dihydrofolate reductase [Saccharopolyspora rhizosphaerae]|uniref:Dihydrofolate reductase n=1 Tax=Saccharopolyspora rhizosphaerae TaxID=2492662 RepID=A0A3R8NYU3_9PSEU|nr:dihydrofolate reductase family protein [Saccharopolyspora rhizosphaerae]RRO12827.1 dihydrofolate reductase [Saccharopolyspora rhizosphaerae]
MRTLTYVIASTIDGRIAGPEGGNPDFFLLEGDHGEFLRAEYPELLPSHVRPMFGLDGTPNRHFDTVLQGRGSWDIGVQDGFTNAYQHLRSIVFSRSIAESPDPTVEFAAGDPVERVRELKREPGQGIWLCGGGTIAAALRPEIDEIIVKLHPVVVGSGTAAFDGDFSPAQFDLVEATPFKSGVVHLHYRRG